MTGEEIINMHNFEKFSNEVLSPMADKFIEEIISNKLTNKQVDRLILLIRNKVGDLKLSL